MFSCCALPNGVVLSKPPEMWKKSLKTFVHFCQGTSIISSLEYLTFYLLKTLKKRLISLRYQFHNILRSFQLRSLMNHESFREEYQFADQDSAWRKKWNKYAAYDLRSLPRPNKNYLYLKSELSMESGSFAWLLLCLDLGDDLSAKRRKEQKNGTVPENRGVVGSITRRWENHLYFQ